MKIGEIGGRHSTKKENVRVCLSFVACTLNIEAQNPRRSIKNEPRHVARPPTNDKKFRLYSLRHDKRRKGRRHTCYRETPRYSTEMCTIDPCQMRIALDQNWQSSKWHTHHTQKEEKPDKIMRHSRTITPEILHRGRITGRTRNCQTDTPAILHRPNYADIERQGCLNAYNMRLPHSTPPSYILAKAEHFPMAITEEALQIKDRKKRIRSLLSNFY